MKNKSRKFFFWLFIVLIFNFTFLFSVYGEDTIEKTGSIFQIVLPGTALGYTIYKKDKEGTKQFLKSFITTVGITYALKYSINAKRPNGGEHSFPSGHSSAAFSGASFLQRRYGWKYGLPAYLIASFVAWSRVYTKNHYVHDVVAGALIGIISTYVFTKPYAQNITITPFVQKNHFAILIYKNF